MVFTLVSKESVLLGRSFLFLLKCYNPCFGLQIVYHWQITVVPKIKILKAGIIDSKRIMKEFKAASLSPQHVFKKSEFTTNSNESK